MHSRQQKPRLSILIPTYRATAHLLCCVRSLARSGSKEDFEICIYGDGGGDAAREAIVQAKQTAEQENIACVTLYNPQNFGNTAAVNACRSLAHGEWLLLVNDDMVFPANWYANIVECFKSNMVTSLSCIEPNVAGHKPAACFVGMNLGLDPATFPFEDLDRTANQLAEERCEEGVNYPFLVEARLYDEVGGVDERFLGPYHDPDLFLRFRLRNISMMRTKKCWLYHFSGVSQRFVDTTSQSIRKRKSSFWRYHENRARILFIKKWGAKPKARFGAIPKTRATMLWENRSHSLLQNFYYTCLLVWEHLRVLWQRAIRL